MKKKIVFLDVDGTLVDKNGVIPSSARRAIHLARENGHQMVLCTGRSRYQLYDELLGLGFDGIVGAAGAYVTCQGEEIFHQFIASGPRREITDYLERNQFIYHIQTDGYTLVNQRCADAMIEGWKRQGVSEERLAQITGRIHIREDLWEDERAEKLLYRNAPFSLEKVQFDIAPDFTVTASSFGGEDRSGEIGIAGINKATGMNLYLKHIGAGRDQAIAIGDGPNDSEMIEFAELGIAMGNALPQLKAVANDVTTAVDEDGIYQAFYRHGLI